MVDASTSLQLILGELTKIKSKMDQMIPSTNVALDEQQKRREELRKKTDERKSTPSLMMQKLLEATLGKGVSSSLTSTENVRFQNIAKALNKVFKIDSISKSIDKFNQANQDALEQQQRKSLFGTITDKIKPPAPPSEPSKSNKVEGSGWMKLGAIGIGLGILGSIFAGKVDLGPFQGTVQLLSKWLSVGGIKGLFFGMEKFFKAFTTPLQLLGKFFSKQATEIVGKVGGKISTKFLAELMPKLLKVGSLGIKALAKIPFGIGSLISFYFAYNRFQKGDYLGALIDVGSGIASFFPGVGTAIAIGLDVLSMIRDFSGTKSEEEPIQPQQKGWFGKSIDSLSEWISTNAYNLPLFGPAIRAYEHFKNNNYKDAFISLLHILPGAGILLDLVDVSETSSREGVEVPKFGIAGKLVKYIKENCYDWPILGPLIRSMEHMSEGNFLEGFISMAHVIPWFGALADLMGVRESQTRGEEKRLTPRTIASMAGYLEDVIMNLPVVGNHIRALNFFADGDVESGFDLILPKVTMSAYKAIKNKFTKLQKSDGVDIQTPTTKTGELSNKLENNSFNQPQKSDESAKFEITGLGDLQETIQQISQEEMQIMIEQRQILIDNRALLQLIAQNTQKMSPNQVFGGKSLNVREEISNTRVTYLDSVNRMATALR